MRRWFCLLPVVLLVPLGLCGQYKALDKTGPQQRLDPAGIKGSLLLCGEGKVPEAALKKFMELAGGDKAELTLLLCQTHTTEAAEEKILAAWSVGKNLHVITLLRAMPIKFKASDFNAQANAIAVEELHLAHEGLALQPPGGAT